MDSQEVILRVIQGKGSPVVQWLGSSADAAEDDGDLLVLLANNIYHPRTQMEEIALDLRIRFDRFLVVVT